MINTGTGKEPGISTVSWGLTSQGDTGQTGALGLAGSAISGTARAEVSPTEGARPESLGSLDEAEPQHGSQQRRKVTLAATQSQGEPGSGVRRQGWKGSRFGGRTEADAGGLEIWKDEAGSHRKWAHKSRGPRAEKPTHRPYLLPKALRRNLKNTRGHSQILKKGSRAWWSESLFAVSDEQSEVTEKSLKESLSISCRSPPSPPGTPKVQAAPGGRRQGSAPGETPHTVPTGLYLLSQITARVQGVQQRRHLTHAGRNSRQARLHPSRGKLNISGPPCGALGHASLSGTISLYSLPGRNRIPHTAQGYAEQNSCLFIYLLPRDSLGSGDADCSPQAVSSPHLS